MVSSVSLWLLGERTKLGLYQFASALASFPPSI
ncbi:hypothetical protein SBA1_880024 [Candidatus Sulfotelmatobacter kueseliae]|uniref:Uncharacterized protein n=1 Tax=Candidatus Sulfotelmatobacter kueseliae TaxID=2042962 RepID=A0A2U3L9Y1_9BACT|nr:hypothetical protein SBA1_880024 [Candidatus Sulfotelmatobacter kueseliae]